MPFARWEATIATYRTDTLRPSAGREDQRSLQERKNDIIATVHGRRPECHRCAAESQSRPAGRHLSRNRDGPRVKPKGPDHGGRDLQLDVRRVRGTQRSDDLPALTEIRVG